jgi:two-component system cell cycle sensor histidine kinase/response regulator CckA
VLDLNAVVADIEALIRRLRGKLPDIKVLYVSGYTDNAIVQQGVLDPQAQFLQKPFNTGSLAAKIHEMLSSP